MRPYFDEIRIVSYLRRQDRHAVSHHQEGARPNRRAEGDLWGHAPDALPDYSPTHDLYLDYDRRLGLWADVFGQDKLDLRVYDRRRLKDGDIVADFLTLIGLDTSDVASVGDKNVSLGAAQTKVGHLMNAARVRPSVADVILSQIDAKGRLLPSQVQARAYLERYRDSNRRLNARFRISDLPDLFEDDFDDYPLDDQDNWTEDSANVALQAVLSQSNELATTMTALSADDLRDAAAALKYRSPEAALRFANAALALRPTGPAILKLKSNLENRLAKSPT